MFQIISLIIAGLALLKAITGLLLPDRFHGWRQQQYASASIPPVVLVVPALFVVLAIASWYATVFQYQAWGLFILFLGILFAYIAFFVY